MSGETLVKVVKVRIKSSGYGVEDLTETVKDVVRVEGLKEGLVAVFTPEPGCSVTMIEYEPGLMKDLERVIREYCGANPALAEALVGKFAAAPVVNGEVALGTFKHFVLVDLSRRAGVKEVLITLEGIHGDTEVQD